MPDHDLSSLQYTACVTRDQPQRNDVMRSSVIDCLRTTAKKIRTSRILKKKAKIPLVKTQRVNATKMLGTLRMAMVIVHQQAVKVMTVTKM
jgi:hypothetical protein